MLYIYIYTHINSCINFFISLILIVCDASCATCDGPLPEDCLTCKSEYYRCNNVYCIYQCLFCQIQSNNTYPVPSDSASEGFCAGNSSIQ